jgi:hypothetical protein
MAEEKNLDECNHKYVSQMIYRTVGLDGFPLDVPETRFAGYLTILMKKKYDDYDCVIGSLARMNEPLTDYQLFLIDMFEELLEEYDDQLEKLLEWKTTDNMHACHYIMMHLIDMCYVPFTDPPIINIFVAGEQLLRNLVNHPDFDIIVHLWNRFANKNKFISLWVDIKDPVRLLDAALGKRSMLAMLYLEYALNKKSLPCGIMNLFKHINIDDVWKLIDKDPINEMIEENCYKHFEHIAEALS